MKIHRQWRWRQRSTTVLVLVLGCSSVPTSGWAQTKTTTIIREKPTQDIDARVEKLYEDGVNAAAKMQWEKARRFFAEAFELDARPQIAANLGNAELQLGKARDAAEHLDYFLREDKDVDEESRTEVKAIFDVAALRIVSVKLTVEHDGADLFIDGVFLGQSPMAKRLFLEPGTYKFEARKKGLKPGSQVLTVSRGTWVDVPLTMGEATNGTELADGTKRVNDEPTDWRKPLQYTSIGVGAVGLGLSIFFTSAFVRENEELKLQRNRAIDAQDSAHDDSNTLQDDVLCPLGVTIDQHCKQLNDTRTRRNDYVNLAFVGYSLTVLGAAGGLTWALTRPKHNASKTRKTPKVGILATPSQLIVFGAF